MHAGQKLVSQRIDRAVARAKAAAKRPPAPKKKYTKLDILIAKKKLSMEQEKGKR